MSKLNQEVQKKAQEWLKDIFDKETQDKVQYLLNNDEKELVESFYKNLEFGTGGLRGIMGVGTNRMNKYTVGMATQGLGNYVKKEFSKIPQIKMAIAYDCRNNSKYFAQVAANILSSLQIKVYLFEDLRPTPELSFAVRTLNCQAGIVITASHNPKKYNGFKAYWCDGGQLVAPHDTNVIKEVEKVAIKDIQFDGNTNNIEILGKAFDDKYLYKIQSLSLNSEIIERQKDLSIVYTPIHGTGVYLVPEILKRIGFDNVHLVKEQVVTDGNFPTVHSPNPEERSALELALKKAKEIDADLVMATDPDADRVGIAVKNIQGEFILLNGNQTGALLFHYLLSQWKENEKLTGNEYIVKTIVTSELLVEIAKEYKVEYFDVLTGFKFIADIIKKYEDDKVFICGGEESYGYLAGDFVRDKDAVMACSLIAEAAAYAKEKGKTLYEELIQIYQKYGLYYEDLISLVKKGKEGSEQIQQIMKDFRENTPKQIVGSSVVMVKDYLFSESKNIKTGVSSNINLPKSNVLQFFLEDDTKISIRPSGTEPKIKFYISVKKEINGEIEENIKQLKEKITAIKKDLL